MFRTAFASAAAGCLALSVIGCGGGGSGDASNPDGNAANTPPTVSIQGPSSIPERTSARLTAVATDAESDALAFQWRLSGGTVAPRATGATGGVFDLEAPDVTAQETMTFTVTVADADGASATDTFTVQVTDTQAEVSGPEVDAGPDRSADEGERITLFGTATARNDRSIRRLEWQQVDNGPRATLDGATDQSSLDVVLPNVGEDSSLAFRLLAEDSAGEVATDTVAVTVRNRDDNLPPQVDAGTNQVVDGGSLVTLSATAVDPDGSIANVRWQQIGGPNQPPLTDADQVTAQFTAPQVAEQSVLSFRFEATDNLGARASDNVDIVIRPRPGNQPPSIDQAFADPGVAFDGDRVTLNVEASDPDADPLAFLWEQVQLGDEPRVAIQAADTKQAAVRLPELEQDARFAFRIATSDGVAVVEAEADVAAAPRSEPAPPTEVCLANPTQQGCPLEPLADVLDPAAFASCPSAPLAETCPFGVLADADPGIADCLLDPGAGTCGQIVSNLLDPSFLLERLPPDDPANTCNPLFDARTFEHYVGAAHEHTGYSDGTINTRPSDVFARVQEQGHDWVGISDHSDNVRLPLTVTGDCASEQLFDCLIADDDAPFDSFRKWQATQEQTDAATSDQFTAFRGFEWTSDRFGHINVFFSEHVINAKTSTGYAVSMVDFWQWFLYPAQLGGGDDGLAVFNHPGREDLIEGIVEPIGGDPAYTFNDMRFVPGADRRVIGIEVFGKGSYYDDGGPGGSWLAHTLDKGWHFGVLGSEDHHGTSWGNADLPKTALIARSLERADLREAMLARRMYALDRNHSDLRVRYVVDGQPMGSRIRRATGTVLSAEVRVTRDGAPIAADVEFVGPGNTVLDRVSGTVARTTLTVGDAESYAFARIRLPERADGGGDRPVAFASPIWLIPGDNPLPACRP